MQLKVILNPFSHDHFNHEIKNTSLSSFHKLFSHLQNKQAGDSISDRSIDRNNHKSREMELQLGTIHILRNQF